MEHVSIEVRTGRETLISLQHVAVQRRILIPLSLLIVLPVVSSAVFLSVGPFSYSRWIRLELPAPQPWLFVSPLMVKEGGRWKRKKEGEHCRHDGTGFHALKYLSDASL